MKDIFEIFYAIFVVLRITAERIATRHISLCKLGRFIPDWGTSKRIVIFMRTS
jgi:hypothetical protein